MKRRVPKGHWRNVNGQLVWIDSRTFFSAITGKPIGRQRK